MCLLAWTYGLGLGSFRYSLKMLALERIRAKHFTKAWGFIKTAEALPVLFGIPLVSFLNEASTHRSGTAADPLAEVEHGRAGYFVCSAATAISTVLLFFIGHPERRYNKPLPAAAAGMGPGTTANGASCNGSLISHCGVLLPGNDCPDLLNRSFNSSSRYGAQNWYPSSYSRCSLGGGGGGFSSMYPPQRHAGSTAQQLPPAYNQNSSSTATDHCHRMNGGGGGGGTTTPISNGVRRGESGWQPPRLQKSLSFAFQTPTTQQPPIMWNEPDHLQHHHYFNLQQQQHHQHHQHPEQQHHRAVNGGTPCFYSRCSSR